MALVGVGDVVGNRYRIRGYLGRGTYGEVWRARDEHRLHDVALKLLPGIDRRAVWREATVLTALRDEHIVEVHNADIFGDMPYLDTALARCSLDKATPVWGVEPQQAVDWIRRALRGLDLCHRARLLHRDIKPSNLFLSQSGDAQLGDFGIAESMDAHGEANPLGDDLFTAPEVLRGRNCTVQSDIYGAALSLYILLTGRSPFVGITDRGDVAQAVERGTYPSLRDLAPHVSQTLALRVRKGMHPDPSKRYPSANEFDAALALPASPRRFAPQQPHQGHERCWTIAGKGAPVSVCLTPGGTSRTRAIRVSKGAPPRTVSKHSVEVPSAKVNIRLRQVFDDYR